ncbi:YitT family protein [Kitasatospora sp. NPDC093550]|uniref:membrane protein YczE n=1 Tax=Kitasatospora sp. NPDC093550 TaxID=3364089 RepID=UPI00381D2A53
METSGHHVHRLPHRPQRHPPEPATGPGPPPRALGYLPLAERPLLRLSRLLLGLALFGFSLALMVRTSLGVNPWSVLYEGLHYHTPLSFGMISAALGALVLLLWIPLRQKPTLGTVANIVVVGSASDLGLLLVPEHLGLGVRIGLVALCILLNGLSVAVYVGARFGPGPRDGLMTGLAETTGRSIRLVRTLIELTVLGAGWLLDGSVGVGTVLYALLVGPVTQFFLPWFTYRPDLRPDRRPDAAARRS